MGEFNVIRYCNEKMGEDRFDYPAIAKFRGCVDLIGR